MKTYVVGSQKNCLIETVLLSTPKKCLNSRIRKFSQFKAQKFYLPGPYDSELVFHCLAK